MLLPLYENIYYGRYKIDRQ